MTDMKYHCVCLAPAIDKTIELKSAPTGIGEIYAGVPFCTTAGGKGLNVARYLAVRGEAVYAYGFLGKWNEQIFVCEMEKYGIQDFFERVAGETRSNIMITWPNGSFKVNAKAFPNLKPEQTRLNTDWSQVAREDWVILSGSLPANASSEYYASLIRKVRPLGAKIALDAHGDALVKGVAAGPDLIKPNADECAALVGFVPRTEDDFKRVSRQLMSQVSEVVISDGPRGAWFNGRLYRAPAVNVVDTTGAGDILLAEYCLHHNPESAVRAGSEQCRYSGVQVESQPI